VSALLRSELLKIRTTGTATTFALVLLGGIVVLALVMCFSQDTLVLAERRAQFELLAVGSNAVFVSGLLGILLMAGEFRGRCSSRGSSSRSFRASQGSCPGRRAAR
jgi:hypothetical protein